MPPHDKQEESRAWKTPGSKKRIRLVMAVVVTLTVWAAVTAWNQTDLFQDKKGRMKALEAELATAKKTNDTLTREVGRLNDPEYRQELGRKDLHLSKPGETVFDVPRANP